MKQWYCVNIRTLDKKSRNGIQLLIALFNLWYDKEDGLIQNKL